MGPLRDGCAGPAKREGEGGKGAGGRRGEGGKGRKGMGGEGGEEGDDGYVSANSHRDCTVSGEDKPRLAWQ